MSRTPKIFGTLFITDTKAKELGLPIADVSLPIPHADMIFGPIDGRYVITFKAPTRKRQRRRSLIDDVANS